MSQLNQQRLIVNVLRNLIFSELKKNDAPCSSQTHFNAAIYGLTQLIPNFTPEMFIADWHSEEDKKAVKELFKFAKEEIESYSPLRNGNK